MNQKKRAKKKKKPMAPAATGGVSLSRKNREEAASQWKSFHSHLRALDELRVEKIEPATVFLWNR